MTAAQNWFESDPLWFKTAVFYEIHLRGFFDGTGDGHGDFRGLAQKLDYLQWLGIDVVWLLPMYPSPMRDGGYDIADFYGVHQDYGSIEDVRAFIEAAHERGIRVIADLVMNHTSSDHAWFQRARKAAAGSPERDGTNGENLPETHDFLKVVRRTVDEEYPDRVLLAEANQWPEDVVEYFGDGDECHMAFHFPVMPRMFMAHRREEATPIYEILDRTPPIPDNCQWGLFLRNHDELTLEMVTDEERDYMYAEYAKEPRMKINVGIRRRLAPLLDNGRDEIDIVLCVHNLARSAQAVELDLSWFEGLVPEEMFGRTAFPSIGSLPY